MLGIETSCDETAIGIVNAERQVLANCVASQLPLHAPHGGVVPEVAARAHLDVLPALTTQALREAGLTLADLSGIAATCGPGLIGGVMVGANFGKALAMAQNKPFVAVNHLVAHALTARLTNDVSYPYLLLLISGGHTQLLYVGAPTAHDNGEISPTFRLLGTTLDDAVGECFDKSAKLLGLGLPGGPALEAAAKRGNAAALALPRPLLGRAGCDFSFAGLKTALRLAVAAETALTPEFVANAAASVQQAMVDCLADRTQHALAMAGPITALVAAGGVAANQAIRGALAQVAAGAGVPLVVPPPALCTDNGVMVAWAGLERLQLNPTLNELGVAARPRWPLAEPATSR